MIEKSHQAPLSADAGGLPRRRIFPVNLLLDGRKALVVGGGKVALEKVRLLLDAGADVAVASAEVSEDFETLPEGSHVTFLRHEFTESDLDETFLVFAATEDRVFNRRVVERSRSRGVLCCSADGNWATGDFALPVVFQRADLTVAISTGGRASKLARTIRDNLSRDIEHADSASTLVIGTSHQYLPIDKREPYHLVGQRLERTGTMLKQLVGIQEFMLLNTCNRVELHALVSDKADMTGLLARVLGFDHLGPGEYYVKHRYEAFEHAAMLSAGLFSQSPGEYHIVSQVKESLGHAVRYGWARGIMQEWVSSALHVSKEIRNTAGLLLKDLEIEDLCISYLMSKRPDLRRERVLVLGSGVVGTTIVERLTRMGLGCHWCYHLTRPSVPEPWADKVELCTFDDLRATLSRSEVIVCATDSPHLVLTQEHAAVLDGGRSVLIVDLTMPRNVDPALDGSSANLEVADLEDLKEWHDGETVDLQKVFELSREVVDRHKDMYEKLAGGALAAR